MSSSRAIALARARWHWLLPAVAIGGLLAPILFTDRTFSTDWGNHLWLIYVQGENIRDLGEPSYYLQSSLGVFYPYYAFYGGSIYALLGLVSWWASPEAAALLAYAGALAASWLGWTWIAIQAGIRGWRAQLPGAIAVTAPLAVTNLYGRGDIPEAIATAVIPLVIAAGLDVFRQRRVRLPAAIAYVGAVAVLTGTHTLTLAWGTVFLLLVAALLIACNWSAVRQRLRPGLAVAGLTALGVCINAWILVPLVLYHTRLLEREPDPIGLTEYTDPERLFSIFRDSGDPFPIVTADVEAQLPVLALLWALVCGVAYWRYLSPANRRLAVGLLGLGGALLLLVLSPSLIEDLPGPLPFIQFPYRVLTFVDLCLVGLVTLALAAMQREGSTSRGPVLALAAIALFNFGLSMQQVFDVRSWLPGREEALASSVQPPPTWYAPLQFADGSAPVVAPTLPPLELPVEGREDTYRVVYSGRAGTAETNIAAGTYLAGVSGAEPVGRSDDGRMVVRLRASAERRRAVEASAEWGPAVSAGRWLTVLSLLAALAAVGYALLRNRGRGHERSRRA